MGRERVLTRDRIKMLFFHEEPEPRNYVVTRCASGPRIRGERGEGEEGLHGESVCEPTLLRFIRSPSLITTKAYLRVYIYTYIQYTRVEHEESVGLRPYYSSNSIEEKFERERERERKGNERNVRTSYIDNRNFTLDRTRTTRRVSLHEYLDE